MAKISRMAPALVVAALLLGATACHDFLDVDNPSVIDVHALDPIKDASLLSGSAAQNFAASYGWLIMYSGWFTGEIDVSSSSPARNEFARRAPDPASGSLLAEVWAPLAQATASAYLVVPLAVPNPGANIDLVKGHHTLAWTYLLMAEQFCSGTVLAGRELTTNEMLDSAIVHFTEAINGGRALNTTLGLSYANASLVGRARTELQRGLKPQALADANAVPAGFRFDILYVDNSANRTRLGNRVWQITLEGSNAVAPAWRVNDPRIPWQASPTGVNPSDGNYAINRGVAFAIQTKYQSFSVPIRLASKIEADYVAAEAQGAAAMLALVQARRAANGQPAYGGATDDASVLAEFEDQRGREFYLEGKRLGDLRRNGAAVRNVPVPNSPYWQPGFPGVGTQTCYPLPQVERDNNPNLAIGR